MKNNSKKKKYFNDRSPISSIEITEPSQLNSSNDNIHKIPDKYPKSAGKTLEKLLYQKAHMKINDNVYSKNSKKSHSKKQVNYNKFKLS